ncbi:hypothetical protein CEXT_572771 [Caerostris extrusa]|uniref:Uncharacterized protein n=1 Tax=Caerostris extrusa TaxID=172846 RepID=A0AAV4PMY7_CAEEX|nr:hypothetical protein CEXT_572771 [Caerostris extrusa]
MKIRSLVTQGILRKKTNRIPYSVRKTENSFVTVSVRRMHSDAVIRNCILRWLPGFLEKTGWLTEGRLSSSKASEYVSREKYLIAGSHTCTKGISRDVTVIYYDSKI